MTQLTPLTTEPTTQTNALKYTQGIYFDKTKKTKEKIVEKKSSYMLHTTKSAKLIGTQLLAFQCCLETVSI